MKMKPSNATRPSPSSSWIEISRDTIPLFAHSFIEAFAILILFLAPRSVYLDNQLFDPEQVGSATSQSLAVALVAMTVVAMFVTRRGATIGERLAASLVCLLYHTLLCVAVSVRLYRGYAVPGPGSTDFDRWLVEVVAHVPVACLLLDSSIRLYTRSAHSKEH